MKCQYCSNEIPDDSVFCPECGQRQTISFLGSKSEVKMESEQGLQTQADLEEGTQLESGATELFCSVCGARLSEADLFCSECGTPCAKLEQEIESQAESQSSPEFNQNEDNWNSTREMCPPLNAVPVQKKKNKAPVIIATVVGGIALIAVVVATVFLFLRKEDSELDSDIVRLENTESTEDEILSEVDYNLLDKDELCVEGFIKKTEAGDYILRMEDEYIFYGEDFNGMEILLEDVRNIYIDDSTLLEGVIDSVKSNETVEINGQCYFMDEKVYITPFIIWDEYGEDLIEAFEDAENEEDANRDYILPQSNSRLLTESDLGELDLREINYAKNEIYARHGRLFQSAELQNYFNSKSWYQGTISPDAFSNSLLSEIERKNADFLSKVEFSIDPNGYKLDSN